MTMSVRNDVKWKMTVRSDRVECVDLHPAKPWLLCSLYGGEVTLWDYEKHALLRRFKTSDLPARAAKFVPRRNWVITGSDDSQIRVFNYNTLEAEHTFEAHSDYIRSIAVHPTQSYILTSGDDLLIKLWNWERGWECQQVFKGHRNFVTQVIFNPKDSNTFASASLDATIRVWQLGCPAPNFYLKGHTKGINCLDYYHGGDKPYLISGADDCLVKIWDYQNKTCVRTLKGHTGNVSAVLFLPELPILLTASEDGSVRIWRTGTYRLQNTLKHSFERPWTMSSTHGSNNVAIGYDEGAIMITMGREKPAASMDVNDGKIIWVKHSEVLQINVKTLPEGTEIKDGEFVPVVVKDKGSCEIYPRTIAHSPNGRFVVCCGDGEYIIYTAMALRNKAFGAAQEFVWAFDNSEYATLKDSTTIKVFRNFKERKSFKPKHGVESIFGGYMLGVSTISIKVLSFYDWENLELIRRMDVQPSHVYWSDSGHLVCLATDICYYVLKFHADVVARAKETTEDGIEGAFETVCGVLETVQTGLWMGDCFIYTNSSNKINYYVACDTVTVARLDRHMYILGYVAKENRLYLYDKKLNIVSYSLPLSVLEYQTAVMQRHFDTADQVLSTVPNEHRTRLGHFLDRQGYIHEALVVSMDPEHKFELALSLGKLQGAMRLAEKIALAEGPTRSTAARWSRLGAAAALVGDAQLTKVCYQNAKQYCTMFILATCTGNKKLLKNVAEMTVKEGVANIIFVANFMLHNLEGCLQFLIELKKIPEAIFFAMYYIPSKMRKMVQLWHESIINGDQSLAKLEQFENLFPELAQSRELEGYRNEIGPTASANCEICLIQQNAEANRAVPNASSSSEPFRHSPTSDTDARGSSSNKPKDSDVMDVLEQAIDDINLDPAV